MVDFNNLSPEQLAELLTHLTPEEREQFDALVKPFPTFVEWVNERAPWYEWHEADRLLAAQLQLVADGVIRFLQVWWPPRHGKSVTISELFSAYYVARYPHRFVGLSSYAAELARMFSRRARDHVRSAGVLMKPDADTMTHWETQQGGGMWAAGVGGPITGKGAHLAIIDDPLKNDEDANSPVIRQKQKDWWESTLRTRLEPNGAIIIVMTRWHVDDLGGWVIARNETLPPEKQRPWRICWFPAVKLAPELAPRLPPGCDYVDDPREAGEALVPERFDREALAEIEADVGPIKWATMFQQMPRRREGSRFKWGWFHPVTERPDNAVLRVRYWDTAGTEGAGDHTAGVLVSLRRDRRFTIEDVVRGQWSPHRRDFQIVETAKRDAAMFGGASAVHIWIEQEAGVAGKDRTNDLIRKLAGFVVRTEPATGSKFLRAEPVMAQAEAGNIDLLVGPWNEAYLDEMVGFDEGVTQDDQVDGTSGAVAKLMDRAAHAFGTFKFRM